MCMLSHSVMPDSLWPHGLQLASLCCPWDFPGKNTGVGSYFLPQGIFLTRDQACLSCINRLILYHWGSRGLYKPSWIKKHVVLYLCHQLLLRILFLKIRNLSNISVTLSLGVLAFSYFMQHFHIYFLTWNLMFYCSPDKR